MPGGTRRSEQGIVAARPSQASYRDFVKWPLRFRNQWPVTLSEYVDLWATDGELSFVTATARAITESMEHCGLKRQRSEIRVELTAGG
jgi:hypothetical protein